MFVWVLAGGRIFVTSIVDSAITMWVEANRSVPTRGDNTLDLIFTNISNITTYQQRKILLVRLTT
jgi:hypothetical protein